jgi:putative membrane protein
MTIMTIIWHLLLLSVTIFIVAQVIPNIRIKNFGTAIIVAIVYSVINLLAGWLLVLITFPLMFITFGLFKFVINAFLLWITDLLIDDFEIKGFGTTLLAAFLITVIDSILKWVIL